MQQTTPTPTAGTRTRLTIGLLASAIALLIACSPAAAATPSLALHMTSHPTHLPPGGTGQISLSVTNDGTAPLSGPITLVVDPLPAGLTATALNGVLTNDGWTCDLPTLTCTKFGVNLVDGETSPILLNLDVAPGATGTVTLHATLTGGGSSTSAVDHATIDASPAGFGITSFSGEVTANEARDPATSAGSHPFDASTLIEYNTTKNENGSIIPAGEQAKDIQVALPPGFVGNPTAAPKCTEDQLGTINQGGDALCPLASQVGVTTIYISGGRFDSTPVFNMVAPDGVTGLFGFNVFGTPVHLQAGVRTTSDYGLTVTLPDISQALPMTGAALTFWGTPADPVHDTQRGRCLTLNLRFHPAIPESCGASLGSVPLLTNPFNCAAGPLTTTLFSDPWDNAGAFDTASFDHDVNDVAMKVDNCDRVPFDPSIDTSPTTTTSSSPTGLDVGLGFPTEGLSNPTGIATAPLKKAQVTLPAGMTINASAADGLTACADRDLKLGSVDPVTCPGAAKIGTAQATSPLLDETLTGAIYLRTQNSTDPESGEMFRIALVLENPERGLSIRLPGSIKANARTGQLSATFDNNPQLPVAKIDLSFKSGPRAPLVAPGTCGTFTTNAALTPWSSDTGVNRGSSFSLDQGCDQAGRFEPSLKAGVVSPEAAGSSPFTLALSRPNGQRAMTGVSTVLPLGLLGSIKDVPLCDASQAAAGTCGDASRVGSVVVGAGAGTAPAFLPQAGKAPTAVYLAGPYKGAPYSLSIVVPAQAGPFDLGTVVVRAGLYVDPISAQVTVKSDPLPTILQGIPADVRDVRVTVDRERFMRNPTNCAAQAVTTAVESAADLLGSPAVNTTGQGFATKAGGAASLSNPFGIANCAGLHLEPNLALSLSGKGQTTDNKHPAVTAVVTQKPGQANLKKVRVALPLSVALDPDNANGLCEFVDGSKVEPTCPKASIVGTATATTPILDQPLSGPVYFVKNIRIDKKSGRQIKTLPKLVVPLVGQNGLRLTLTGTSDVDHDQLVTTFDNIPDAPVSSFKMNIIGGKGGILVVSGTDICKATQIADQQIDGQNGKAADADVYIQTPSCPLKVISKKVGKSSVAVKVGGLGSGKVTITGKGIKKTTKTIAKSTVATITAKRTKGKPGKVKVSYDPTGPAKARKTTK